MCPGPGHWHLHRGGHADLGGSGVGGSQATWLGLHPALGLLPGWTVVDGDGTGTLGREEPELDPERSCQLVVLDVTLKGQPCTHLLSPKALEALAQARPSIIFTHPHSAQDRPRLRLFSEACSAALLGPGLSCPEQRGPMAPGSASPPPGHTALRRRGTGYCGFARCSRLHTRDPKGPWLCLFPFVPQERAEDVSTRTSSHAQFAQLFRKVLRVLQRRPVVYLGRRTTPTSDPHALPRRDPAGPVVSFCCGPSWTSYPDVDQALTSPMAPGPHKDTPHVPDSCPDLPPRPAFSNLHDISHSPGDITVGTSLQLWGQRAAPTSLSELPAAGVTL